MARGSWTKSKIEIQKRTEQLERTSKELRNAINTAEETNTKITEENRKGAENFREMGDKVYSLMDQLRLNQVREGSYSSTIVLL
jgi:dynactin complex subunit